MKATLHPAAIQHSPTGKLKSIAQGPETNPAMKIHPNETADPITPAATSRIKNGA
jgi:hypothetical protein